MAPQTMCPTKSDVQQNLQPKPEPEQPWVYGNFFKFGLFHLGAMIGVYMLPYCKLQTLIFSVIVYYLAEMGITAGAHRLWSHRSYKARLPFRIFLGICNSMAFQNDIIEWSRDHRVHHKYSETDADPHNAKRGFFFSHMGWLLMRKHPLVKAKGRAVDVSDLYNDPVCAWQRRLYMPSIVLLCFVLPSVIPWYCWQEDLSVAFFVAGMLRYTLSLHFTWCVNSIAHLLGNKPYDRFINPAENFLVTLITFGEGFHNYHHTFPHDYATSEYGTKFNLTTLLLDAMALVGQVYERRTMPGELVQRRKDRSGDGSNGFGYTTPTPTASPETKSTKSE